MSRGAGDKPAQTVDKEQQAHQGESVGQKMIHLPAALFNKLLHHGTKQMTEEDAAEAMDDPQQQEQPMPMTQVPQVPQGLARTGPPL